MSDLINRQAAIDAAIEAAYKWDGCYSVEMARIIADDLKALPSAQSEPSIPLSWFDEQIERLKGLNNAFATLTAMQISGMVKKWSDEQDGERK